MPPRRIRYPVLEELPLEEDEYDEAIYESEFEFDDEEAEDDEEEDDDEEEEDEEDVEYLPPDYVPPPPPPPRAAEISLSPIPPPPPARRIAFEELENQPEEGELNGVVDGNGRRREEGEASTSSSSPRKVGSQVTQSSGNETEGVCCPICMESWSSEGSHQISCLPCGHLYGFSCIQRWIRQKGSNSKCPQCSKKCAVKDIIKLYISRILVTDGEQQKKLLALQAENEFLKMKVSRLQEKVCQDKEDNIPKEEVKYSPPCCSFELEDELVVDGARIFDIDASSQMLVLARRLPGMGGIHILTKISLVYPYESENIQLPSTTKAIKDLRVSPSSGRLALFASLGKKLSILSMESNNIVLTYNLPVPAWSCSWDLNSPHHIYAGLQNGTVLVFDMRQTVSPIESINGLTCHPVHTIHSLQHKPTSLPGVRTLLSASSIGPCIWNTGGVTERSFLVPEMQNQGVCISLAYSPSNDDIVASFRPKVQISNDISVTQSLLSSPSGLSRGVLGSHVHIKRTGASCYQNLGSVSANVNDVRMPKSAIININGCNPLFAYGDETTHGLSLHDLPSLRVFQRLRPHQHPILDVKYASSVGRGILGCTSEDRLQIFSARVS